jgi:hypothetical protein
VEEVKVLDGFINVQHQEVFYCTVLRTRINLIYVRWAMEEVEAINEFVAHICV